jgi:dTDP-4-amino-4,6-dideoxygalactose transaminase
MGRELEYLRDAIARGHLSGDGEYTHRCQQVLEELHPGSRVLLTTSCTHALELCALLLDVGPGDEVILPSFTFASTANAFVLRGAMPVFVDVRPDTLNLDESGLAARLTARTRAIVVVHYAGVACEMDTISALARERSITIVEDNAHGLLGGYRGKPLGTFGAVTALSFHETKNITCGEGGALLVNDPDLVARAEILREKGTDRSRFFRGEVDRYGWIDLGSSYLPSELTAAFLLGQLEARQKIQKLRRRIWKRYREGLADWANRRGVQLPVVPVHCRHPYHLFYLLHPNPGQRQALIAHLRQRGVQAVIHYLPLHDSVMGVRFGGRRGDCPVSESSSDRILRLPLYPSLGAADVDRVIEAVRAF